MSMQSHIVELEKKHRALEQEIQLELAHAHTDEVKLSSLKRKKLRIKDEMTRLKKAPPTLH